MPGWKTLLYLSTMCLALFRGEKAALSEGVSHFLWKFTFTSSTPALISSLSGPVAYQPALLQLSQESRYRISRLETKAQAGPPVPQGNALLIQMVCGEKRPCWSNCSQAEANQYRVGFFFLVPGDRWHTELMFRARKAL